MKNFQQWLQARNLDIQSIAPDMRRALVRQFRQEQIRLRPPVTRLVLVDERWPARAFRTEVML